MPCPRCVGVAENPGAGRTSCMPTRAMTLRVAAPTCASGASRRVLPGAASNAMIGSGVIAGWSSAHMLGWLPSASCVLALSGASTFMSHCFLWLAASSAFAISHRFVSRSKSHSRCEPAFLSHNSCSHEAARPFDCVLPSFLCIGTDFYSEYGKTHSRLRPFQPVAEFLLGIEQ